jgi:hypothetical protein
MEVEQRPRADIGHDVTIEVRLMDGAIAGVAYWHPCLNGARWEGWIPLDPNVPDHWDLVREVPITITPSLLCRICGHHGHITEGRWVPSP